MTALADLDNEPAKIEACARSVSNYDLPRPFYFMVPFWGERYRQYFIDRLLPSLLASNNLPLLNASDGHRFLIATTREDWIAIADLPIVSRLRKYALPTLVEIPPPVAETAPGSTTAVRHQDFALQLLVDAAWRDKAYGSVHWPDTIVSDGMVASLLRHAKAGDHLVLCPALRQTEEAVVSELRSGGFLSDVVDQGADHKGAINVPQRVLGDIMVRHLHPEMAKFEEGAADQPVLPPFRYIRLPDRGGIILHTFHASPVLMDYGAVVSHDLTCLRYHSFEDAYVACNFDYKNTVHVVQDTDEFCILSLTPAAIGQMPTVSATLPNKLEDGFARRTMLAASIAFHAHKRPLKKLLFQRAIRWHGSAPNGMTRHNEGRYSTFIDRGVRYSSYAGPMGAVLSAYLRSPALAGSIPYVRFLTKALSGDERKLADLRRWVSFEISGPFKRAGFWLASRRSLDRFDPYHLSFRKTSGRHEVSAALFSPSPTTAVILGVGQSNIANECDPAALYGPAGDVFNFNFFDGKCYQARDPLLGASIDRSNPMTRLGDLLVASGRYRRVLLVPIAHGGTFAREWSPGGRMFPRLEWTLQQLREKAIALTHIAWQQGESEAAEPDSDPEDWVRHFTGMTDAIRAARVDAPIYVAQCTICRSEPNERIRAAQRRVIDPAAGIFPGPDLDVIGRDERYDGCHFSVTGLKHAANLWCEALNRPN